MATFPIAAILDGRGTLGEEYEIVHRAAARHARNYVAFDYLRRRMVGGVRSEGMGQGESESDGDGEGVRDEMAMPLSVQTLMAHALANPSDISRLSFLQHVLGLHSRQPSDQEHTTTTTTTIGVSSSAAATVQHILDTALRLHLRGDAIWTFLRSALLSWDGAGVGDQERLEMLEKLREWLDEVRGGGSGEDVKADVYARDFAELRAVVERSLRWIARWEGGGKDGGIDT